MGAADFVMCSTHDHTMRKEKEKKNRRKRYNRLIHTRFKTIAERLLFRFQIWQTIKN